jgi:hypothetical protein
MKGGTMQAMDNSATNPAVVPLEYGRSDRIADATRNLKAEFWQRVHGVAYFLGVLLGAAGGLRQVAWAIGLTCALGGLGDCLAGHYFTPGPMWMALGGFLIGLAFPLPSANKGRR